MSKKKDEIKKKNSKHTTAEKTSSCLLLWSIVFVLLVILVLFIVFFINPKEITTEREKKEDEKTSEIGNVGSNIKKITKEKEQERKNTHGVNKEKKLKNKGRRISFCPSILEKGERERCGSRAINAEWDADSDGLKLLEWMNEIIQKRDQNEFDESFFKLFDGEDANSPSFHFFLSKLCETLDDNSGFERE